MHFRTKSIILLVSFITSQAHAVSAQSSDRAVVIVSGGAAVSPFTTPKDGCKTGYVAGSTDSYMRDYLIARGYSPR
jgi:triacylglycerol lipase